MRNIDKILDKARAMCNPPTDYRLAKNLEVSPQVVSNWRRQAHGPNNLAAYKLARFVRMSPADVIAYIEEDRAKDPATKDFWARQLPRVLPTVAIGFALSLANTGDLTAGVGSDEAQTSIYVNGLSIHYAHRARRCRKRRTASGLGCARIAA